VGYQYWFADKNSWMGEQLSRVL